MFETFPQIESKCYEIIGQNLQNFMNILGKDIDTDKRLKIGSFYDGYKCRSST